MHKNYSKHFNVDLVGRDEALTAKERKARSDRIYAMLLPIHAKHMLNKQEGQR